MNDGKGLASWCDERAGIANQLCLPVNKSSS